MKHWGEHLILDCAGCNDAVKSKAEIIRFVKFLVDEIHMKAYGEPIVEHFATHDPSKGGYSLVQLIETSAVTAHFVDESKECYLDIFSCKEIPIERTKATVQAFFEPTSIKITFLTRQA
jgi:S-adenosylmethionine/arginine decarboxylase-like enzyme